MIYPRSALPPNYGGRRGTKENLKTIRVLCFLCGENPKTKARTSFVSDYTLYLTSFGYLRRVRSAGIFPCGDDAGEGVQEKHREDALELPRDEVPEEHRDGMTLEFQFLRFQKKRQEFTNQRHRLMHIIAHMF